MADVFLSYASEDRETARRLAETLARRGWSVWWDRHLVAGQRFDDVIERELATAGAVVVLWSSSSVGKDWVKGEAADGAERGVLVPARLDATSDPYPWDPNEPHTMMISGLDVPLARCAALRFDVAVKSSKGDSVIVELTAVGVTDDGRELSLLRRDVRHPIGKRYGRESDSWAVDPGVCRPKEA